MALRSTHFARFDLARRVVNLKRKPLPSGSDSSGVCRAGVGGGGGWVGIMNYFILDK